jgi:imidazole glycerol-phosphate synthase subunit HisH
MGNLRSVLMKFERLKVKALISRNPEDILAASKLVLPGVGHFAEGMKNIREYGIYEPLCAAVSEQKIPILGICLGMQLLTKSSEEGNVDGLGWINAVTKRFNFNSMSQSLRIPHVGWNLVNWKKESILMKDLDTKERFYFTHSYAVECLDQANSVGVTDYGYQFSSIIQCENIYGTQFHPEKSHLNGLKLIENFVNMA